MFRWYLSLTLLPCDYKCLNCEFATLIYPDELAKLQSLDNTSLYNYSPVSPIDLGELAVLPPGLDATLMPLHFPD